MLNDLIAWLLSCGYYEAKAGTDVLCLGEKEYLVQILGGQHGVTIGSGKFGDEGCCTVFYFNISTGEMINHASLYESNEASNS